MRANRFNERLQPIDFGRFYGPNSHSQTKLACEYFQGIRIESNFSSAAAQCAYFGYDRGKFVKHIIHVLPHGLLYRRSFVFKFIFSTVYTKYFLWTLNYKT